MDKNLLEKTKASMIALISPNTFRGGVNNCKPIVYKINNSLKTKTKRAFALLMLALLAPAAAWAQTFGGGSGTETDPYIISSKAHWQELASNVNNGVSNYGGLFFRLDADISFSSSDTYYPIGRFDGQYAYRYFSGQLDGNGHTISNVTVHWAGTNNVGLFGVLSASAVVKDLTLKNCDFRGADNVGAIAGLIYNSALFKDRGVINCRVAGNVSVTGQNYVGGIVGATYGESSVSDCVFLGSVSGSSHVGAITGFSYVHIVYENGNTSVDPDQQSMRCLIGGNCTAGAIGVNGSTQGTDELTSAKHITIVSFGSDVSGSVGTAPAITFGGSNYYECGTAVDLSLAYTGTVATGYIVESFLANGNAIARNDNGYTATLPSLVTNVNITAQPNQAVRDIGYEPWISITTP